MLNQGNYKRTWNDRSTLRDCVIQKKPAVGPAKYRPTALTEPCGKCSWTNHT